MPLGIIFLTVYSVFKNLNTDSVRDCTHASGLMSKEQYRNAQLSFVSFQVSMWDPTQRKEYARER